MLGNIGFRCLNVISRNVTTLSRQQVAGKLLKSNAAPSTGRRMMSGHGPDISKMQAALYIIIGGGSFAAFGMYQATSMRNRIEAFETGKTIPFKTMSDDEYLEYAQKFKELHSDSDE